MEFRSARCVGLDGNSLRLCQCLYIKQKINFQKTIKKVFAMIIRKHFYYFSTLQNGLKAS